MAKHSSGFVVKENAENLVVNQALGQLGSAAKDLFHLQRGAGFTTDFIEQEQRFGLLLGAFEKARVFDRGTDAAGDERKNASAGYGVK